MNKLCSLEQALAPLKDGDTVLVGGFGPAGTPEVLLEGVLAHGARELTVVSNNAGNGQVGIAALIQARRVKKIICSYPRQRDSEVFDQAYRAGEIELELIPQGNLAERIRAAGAGIGAFFCPTGYGTELAFHPDGSAKETRVIKGRGYVLEYPIEADVALIKAELGDAYGNLSYRKTARNFGPVMAMAAKHTVASVHQLCEALDPEHVSTAGIFVQALVAVPRRPWQA